MQSERHVSACLFSAGGSDIRMNEVIWSPVELISKLYRHNALDSTVSPFKVVLSQHEVTYEPFEGIFMNRRFSDSKFLRLNYSFQ